MVAPSGPQSAVPLYLRYQDAMNAAIVSHNAATHNVLLRVTVPKRTGRKRKRGSNGPWEGDVATSDGAPGTLAPEDPRELRRKLQDTVGTYEAEAVGKIKQTHRFRGE